MCERYIARGPLRTRRVLARQTMVSRTMDSHLLVVSGASSCYPSSETKMNPRKEEEGDRPRSVAMDPRDESAQGTFSKTKQAKNELGSRQATKHHDHLRSRAKRRLSYPPRGRWEKKNSPYQTHPLIVATSRNEQIPV